MPHYEFACLDCKKNFVTALSLIDYVEGDRRDHSILCAR